MLRQIFVDAIGVCCDHPHRRAPIQFLVQHRNCILDLSPPLLILLPRPFSDLTSTNILYKRIAQPKHLVLLDALEAGR
jgi:hypothetical protein